MTPHPIDAFLEVWERESGHRGVSQRLRVYRALSVERAWSQRRLRATLRALLATGADERARFDLCFNDFFSAAGDALPEGGDFEELQRELRDAIEAPEKVSAPEDVARTPTEVSPQISAPPSDDTSNNAASAEGRLTFGFIGIMAALLVAVAAQPSALVRVDHRDAATDAVVDASAAPVPSNGPFELVEMREIRSRPRGFVRSGDEAPSHLLLRALGLCVAALAFVTLGEQRLRAIATRPVPVPPPPRADDADFKQRVLDLSWPDAMPPPLTREECESLAERTGFSHEGAHRTLDLPATVQATARGGGLLVTVERPTRRPNTLRIVRPRTINPYAEHMLDALERGLRAAGVLVERGEGGPERGRGDLNLLVLDASAGYDPSVDAWARMGHTVFLEARDAGRWGPEVTALPRGVFPLTYDGLSQAIDAARLDRRPPPSKPLTTGDARDRLRETFPLAQAFALTAPIDLAGLDALRRALTPWVEFIAMQRVVDLDGVTGGPPEWRVSDALRAQLCGSLTPDTPMWRDALSWQLDRLARVRAPEDSHAEALLELERDLCAALLDGLDAIPMSRLARLKDHPVLGRVLRRRVREVTALRPFAPPRDYTEAVLAGAAGLSAPPKREAVSAREGRVRTGAAVVAAVAACGGAGGAVWSQPRVTVSWLGPTSDPVGVDAERELNFGCSASNSVFGIVGFDPRRRPICAQFNPRSVAFDRGSAFVLVGTPSFVPLPMPLSTRATTCPSGSAVTGFDGEITGPASPMIVRIAMLCGAPIASGGLRETARVVLASIAGVRGARPFRFDCGPDGHVIAFTGDVSSRGYTGLRVQCATTRW